MVGTKPTLVVGDEVGGRRGGTDAPNSEYCITHGMMTSQTQCREEL